MTAHKPGDPTTINRLYGRSKGKPLRAGQQESGRYAAAADRGACRGRGDRRSACSAIDRPLHFEIGFGGGEHMADRADMLPDHGFIGAEPFLNGVAQALVHVAGDHGAKLPLGNVRIHHGDALDVLQRIPDGALSFAYLLHPDPWPKARHAKRRMMNDGPLDLIAAKLKPGGEFRFGTDHPIYLAARADGHAPPPPPVRMAGRGRDRISRTAPAAGPKPATKPRRAGWGTRSGISATAAADPEICGAQTNGAAALRVPPQFSGTVGERERTVRRLVSCLA